MGNSSWSGGNRVAAQARGSPVPCVACDGSILEALAPLVSC